MSTKQRTLSQATASNSSEEDDIGALIYRESQLRKREAAAAAARSGRNSSMHFTSKIDRNATTLFTKLMSWNALSSISLTDLSMNE